MCLDFYGASATFLFYVLIANFIFCILFILEAACKIIGLGPSFYFSFAQNCFDFFLILTGISTLLAQVFQTSQINLTIFRIFRAARLLRMIKASKTI